jgi:Ala-tRNA(Pro) deacylase
MPVKILKEYLDNHHVKYSCVSHSRAFTAQEVAESAHVSGKNMAKTVIVKIDNQLAMVVLPAHDYINFDALKAVTGAVTIDLASESEFKSKFPECDAGAMPPFGNLYEMPVYASSRLSQHHQMVFSAGTHIELMQLAYADFERLVKPKVLSTGS